MVMNVGFIISSLHGGGEEKRVRDISQYLAQNGCRVHVFCADSGDAELRGVNVVKLRKFGGLGFIHNVRFLLKEIREQDIQVLFCFKRSGSVIGYA